MEKRARTDHPIHELIQNRWSPRAFAERAITPSLLSSLFEAARWAPSAYNDQPWYFIIAEREAPDEFARLLSCLVAANQSWAKYAAVLAIAVARMRFAHDGSPNPHAAYDTGQAVQSLCLQATALGISVHQMGGFSPQKARELYGIPAAFEPLTAVALGYLGDPTSLPKKLSELEVAPRTRRPIRDFVFGGAFAMPARFLQQ